uniref:Uncharacterized protein n=1 Tax=Siphoviridae sp. ctLqe90 TaxID=2825456 RepID=A0A8S5Q3T4_9CAUD|nr:MAG TPA: hypothetical protein [Siphoviridae sp. ctLqe90]
MLIYLILVIKRFVKNIRYLIILCIEFYKEII